MRPPTDDDQTPIPYNRARCRETYQLRHRLRALQDRIAALEAALAAERAGLVAHLESPEAERDVMLIAQKLLRDEMIAAVRRRATCDHCGGLGAGMSRDLLTDRIEAHCTAHDLPREAARADDWPFVLKGYQRNDDWLRRRTSKTPIW